MSSLIAENMQVHSALHCKPYFYNFYCSKYPKSISGTIFIDTAHWQERFFCLRIETINVLTVSKRLFSKEDSDARRSSACRLRSTGGLKNSLQTYRSTVIENRKYYNKTDWHFSQGKYFSIIVYEANQSCFAILHLFSCTRKWLKSFKRMTSRRTLSKKPKRFVHLTMPEEHETGVNHMVEPGPCILIWNSV